MTGDQQNDSKNGPNGDEMRQAERVKRLKRRSHPGRMHLMDRDIAALQAVSEYRFLSGDQLGRLVFECSASRQRRRMRALFDHALVDRVALATQPASGLPPYVYVLSRKGAATLRESGIDVPSRGVARLSSQTYRHDLLVNDFRIAISVAARRDQWDVFRWRDEQQLKLRSADGRGRVERVEHRQLAQPAPFLPDGYFELGKTPNATYAFFVEIDLATHPQSVWRHRAKLYRAYADPASGLFRRRFGRETFRVLVATTPDFRLRSRGINILDSISASIGISDMFLVTSIDELVPERILEPIWRNNASAERMRIIETNQSSNVIRVSPSRQSTKPSNVVRVWPRSHPHPPEQES